MRQVARPKTSHSAWLLAYHSRTSPKNKPTPFVRSYLDQREHNVSFTSTSTSLQTYNLHIQKKVGPKNRTSRFASKKGRTKIHNLAKPPRKKEGVYWRSTVLIIVTGIWGKRKDKGESGSSKRKKRRREGKETGYLDRRIDRFIKKSDEGGLALAAR